MTKMKRTLAFVVAVVGLTFAAGSASALSSVNVLWKSNGLDTITPTAGQTVTAIIVLEGDSVGIGGVFVTILFDTTELDVISVSENQGPAAKVGMGNQFAPLSAGVTIDEAGGQILGFDSAAGLSTGCINCTITIGSVVFNAVAPVGLAGTESDVSLAVLPNGIDGIVSAFGGSLGGALTTAAFGDAEVVGAALPEPTTALLVVGGLLGLGYAGRRSVR
jgi:hypothetical protein